MYEWQLLQKASCWNTKHLINKEMSFLLLKYKCQIFLVSKELFICFFDHVKVWNVLKSMLCEHEYQATMHLVKIYYILLWVVILFFLCKILWASIIFYQWQQSMLQSFQQTFDELIIFCFSGQLIFKRIQTWIPFKIELFCWPDYIKPRPFKNFHPNHIALCPPFQNN